MTQEHGSASETAKGQPRQELGIKYWNHGKDWFKKKKKNSDPDGSVENSH